jgi:hypothetical protein
MILFWFAMSLAAALAGLKALETWYIRKAWRDAGLDVRKYLAQRKRENAAQ